MINLVFILRLRLYRLLRRKLRIEKEVQHQRGGNEGGVRVTTVGTETGGEILPKEESVEREGTEI